jgi:hypothetical protein
VRGKRSRALGWQPTGRALFDEIENGVYARGVWEEVTPPSS